MIDEARRVTALIVGEDADLEFGVPGMRRGCGQANLSPWIHKKNRTR